MGKWTEEAKANLSKKLRVDWARRKRMGRKIEVKVSSPKCSQDTVSSKLNSILAKLDKIANQLA